MEALLDVFAKASFYVLALLACAATFTLIVTYGSEGKIWIWVLPIIISPVAMWAVRVLWEQDWRPNVFAEGGIFSPSTQSWAFLFGDTFALPLAFGASAVAWRTISVESWARSWWWLAIAIIVGVLVSYGWHTFLDAPGYIAAGHADALGSPTKLWHDYVVYGSLAAGLAYLGIPALVTDFNGAGWIALVGVIIWALLGTVGDGVIRKLDPGDLHPPVQSTRLV